MKKFLLKACKHVRPKWLAALIFSGAAILTIFQVFQNLQPQMNELTIEISDPNWPTKGLKVAVLGDLHLHQDEKEYAKLAVLLKEVTSAKPDLVAFVGDYTAEPSEIMNMQRHRRRLIRLIKSVQPTPYVAILGNYETYSVHHRWLMEATSQRMNLFDNDVQIISTKAGDICVRGLGDAYTNHFEFKPFPYACEKIGKLTITHDPAGAFEPNMHGLIVAGHTHCGQVSFPFIGPLWVPTKAPKDAHCGLYQDKDRTLFVTSGVGTSLLPIRFGAQAQWDLLQINGTASRQTDG